jgi:hypothetical protein
MFKKGIQLFSQRQRHDRRTSSQNRTRRVPGKVMGSAHPEFPGVTADYAEVGVKLLRQIVKYVYILPDERAEKRKVR